MGRKGPEKGSVKLKQVVGPKIQDENTGWKWEAEERKKAMEAV